MPKLNIIEWFRSFRNRQFSEDHSIMGVANGLVSQEYGKLRKEAKLASRRKGARS